MSTTFLLGFACWLFLLFSGGLLPGFSQIHKPLCRNGNNSFSATLSGVASVAVGAQKSGGLAQRTCQAILGWRGEDLVVAHDVPEVDLDLFGVDVESVGRVAAFQVKSSVEQCCRQYLLYSLTDRPHLIRTIEGGFFKAQDYYLDGRIGIWAEDAACINGFDGLPTTDIQFPPTLVLRFENGKLLDATSEFAPYFDLVVATVRAQMDPATQQAFKNTNGKPQFSVNDVDKFVSLQRMKIQALEIVWAYLYSGREQEAWATLAEMWPANDVERIRSLIVNARKNGILAQVDGQSTLNTRGKIEVTPDSHANAVGASRDTQTADIITLRLLSERRQKTQIFRGSQMKRAIPIAMWAPQLSSTMNRRLSRWDVTLLLVIDSAGKVYSVQPTDKKLALDDDFRALLETARQWRFIPAMKNDHSVASEMETTITLQR